MVRKLALCLAMGLGSAVSAWAASELRTIEQWYQQFDEVAGPVTAHSSKLETPAVYIPVASSQATSLLAIPPLVTTMPVRPPLGARWKLPTPEPDGLLASIGEFLADATRPSGVARSLTAGDAASSPVLLVFVVGLLGAGAARYRRYSG